MSLPAAAVLPSCLRLPRSRLLLRSLRLLLLTGLLHRLLPLRLLTSLLGRLMLRLLFGLVLRLLLPGLLNRLLPLRHLLMSLLDLLRFRCLSTLRVLLDWRPLLRLLCAGLRPLWLCLGARLLLRACRWSGLAGWRGLLRPALLLFRLTLFLLLVLCVCRDDHPEKQKRGRGAGSSNKLRHNHSSDIVTVASGTRNTSRLRARQGQQSPISRLREQRAPSRIRPALHCDPRSPAPFPSACPSYRNRRRSPTRMRCTGLPCLSGLS